MANIQQTKADTLAIPANLRRTGNGAGQSYEAMQEEIAALKAQLKQAQAAKQQAIRIKVSEKKAVSIYGINGRFPITLYGNQWLRLIEAFDAIKQFIEENREGLAWK